MSRLKAAVCVAALVAVVALLVLFIWLAHLVSVLN